jgi:hypothetical protein
MTLLGGLIIKVQEADPDEDQAYALSVVLLVLNFGVIAGVLAFVVGQAVRYVDKASKRGAAAAAGEGGLGGLARRNKGADDEVEAEDEFDDTGVELEMIDLSNTPAVGLGGGDATVSEAGAGTRVRGFTRTHGVDGAGRGKSGEGQVGGEQEKKNKTKKKEGEEESAVEGEERAGKDDWKKKRDKATGKDYYVSRSRNASQWDKPSGM